MLESIGGWKLPEGFPPWVLGVIFGITACVGIAFGMTSLKYTHMKIERLNERHDIDPANNPPPKPFYCHCSWVAGFSLIILASGPMDMGALALLPQSVFAPLSGLTLCLNAVISPWLLGENLTRFDAAATVLVVIGAAMTTMFGSHTNEDFSVDIMMELFSAARVMVFECIIWVVTATCIVSVRSQWFVQAYMQEDNQSRVAPAMFGLIAGGAGSQQFLFLKATIELFKTAVEDGGSVVFLKFQTYLFLGAAIMCALIQIKFLNEGLAACDVVTFLPIYNTWLIMMGVLNGALVFNEFTAQRMGPISHYVYFFLGCSLCLLGIMALMLGGPSKLNELEENEDDENSALLKPPASPPSNERSCTQSAKDLIPFRKDALPAKLTKPSTGPNPSDVSTTFKPAGPVNALETPAITPHQPPSTEIDQDIETGISPMSTPMQTGQQTGQRLQARAVT